MKPTFQMRQVNISVSPFYIVSISPSLLNCFTLSDHFDHIKEVIGAESIGIGGDYEGVQR